MDNNKKEPDTLKIEFGDIKVSLDIGLKEIADKLLEITLINKSPVYANFVAENKIAAAKKEEIANIEKEKKIKADEEERLLLIDQLKASTDPDIKKIIELQIFENNLAICNICWLKLIKDKKIDSYLDKLNKLDPASATLILMSGPQLLEYNSIASMIMKN